MALHELKTLPEYYQAVKNDRSYEVDDELLLLEFITNDHDFGDFYTGNICHRKISYIFHGGQYGLETDYVILGIVKI